MNIDRLLADGSRDENEIVNKSQIYVTTAGYKNSFAYEKLMQLTVQQVIEPEKALILGGTYKVPVFEKLLSSSFVKDLKDDATFNEASFDREYRSIWVGDAENAFFSSERFDKQRSLGQSEEAYNPKSPKGTMYIISVDVGRKGCTSEAVVTKLMPNEKTGGYSKNIVNIYSWEDEHFELQAIKIKQLYYKYRAEKVVIDANGLGIGLIDYMVKSQTDEKTGEILPDFGISNDDEKFYKKFRTQNTELDAVFLIKANAPLNTEAYSYIQAQMNSGKIKFLIDEAQAKVKLMSLKVGREMSVDKRAEYLRPFTLTSVLKEEMVNLVESNDGINIILKQSTKSIKKDKFSAFCYGMYYIRKMEESKKKRGKRNIKDFMFFTK